MREIQIPHGTEPIAEFTFVKILVGGKWTPALLEAWYRTPDGWVCRIRTARHKAVNGRVTHGVTVLYDPAVIQPLTAADLNG